MIESRPDTIEKPARAEKGAAKAWLRALELTAPIAKAPWRTFPTVIEELADKCGDVPALLSDDESLSFRALNARANRFARWALAQDIRNGDAVCLLMTNRPEYMAIWLGITRVGGAVALLNTNLAGPSLAHCIDVVTPKHIVVAGDLVTALETARPHLVAPAQVWSHGAGTPRYPDVAAEVASLSGDALERHESRAGSIDDRALYVYTSGAAGLPKAANISHYRLMVWTHWFAGMMDTGPADRMYNC